MGSKIKFLVLFLITVSSYSQGVVTQNGRLQVVGNEIRNKNNIPFSVAGNSFFWSGFQGDGGFFYEASVVDKLATDWNSQLVRAAMAVEQADSGRGYISDPAGEVAKIKPVIDAAIANDIYVIIDFHTHYAHDYLTQAKTFFTQMVREYGGNDHVIYEIYNEPKGDQGNQTATWNNQIKPYAEEVIKSIRDEEVRLGYTSKLIVVGTPFFSQGVDVASLNPISNSSDNNIAYTLHFYSGTHSQFLRNKAITAMDNGIALFVTEWGSVNASGMGSANVSETNAWMKFLKERNISSANWSVSDKAEGASIISSGSRIGGLLNDNLTDSGSLVRCIISKWNDEATFSNCAIGESTVDPTPTPTPGGTGDCAGIAPPNAPARQGVKVQIETVVGTVDTASKANSDFRSAGLSTGSRSVDCEAVITGFIPGEAASFRIETTRSTEYTFFIELSSTASNFTLELQRDAGTVTLASQAIPNTGGLENYTALVISGVILPNGKPDIAIAIGGTGVGSVNIESFTYVPDSEVLSIDDLSLNKTNINIYPNPVQDKLYISTTDNKDVANTSYAIYSISGATMVPSTELTSQEVNTELLLAGVYFIVIEKSGRQTTTIKFVKE